MCIVSRDINKIIVAYCFLILFLDNMLNMPGSFLNLNATWRKMEYSIKK